MFKLVPYFLLIALLFINAAAADLSGHLKYAYETNYLDEAASQQIFTQEYLTNLRGAVLDDRVGSYQLGLQYQRGTAELRNFTFSNTLNFREAISVSTSYLRKDFENLLFSSAPIADNRLSVSASYYPASLPSFTVAYETGDSKSASAEGVNKTDKKASVGLNYAVGGSSISARYVRGSLQDNTYLSSSANLVNRDGLFTLNGAGKLGEKIEIFSTYSDQQVYNQVGSSSQYNQKLQNITAAGNLRLLPFLTFSPELTQTANLIDYDLPTAQKNYQQFKKIGLAAKLRPNPAAEFVFDVGGGQVEVEDSAGGRRQDLFSRRLGFNFDPAKDLNLNLSLKSEDYSGASAAGKVTTASGHISFPLQNEVKLSYKRDLTYYDGEVYSLAAGSTRNQDANIWGLGVNFPSNIIFEGEASFTTVNAFSYRGESAGVKYSPSPARVLEVKRENKIGNEVTQTIDAQTDSLKATFPVGAATVSQQIALIKTRSYSGSAPITSYDGFKNTTEVYYTFGDSAVTFNLNSERRDQNSSAYTRSYLSFTRNF